MSSLDLDTITQLLAGEAAQERANKPENKYPRAMQLGSLRYSDNVERCVNRGCASPTMIRINGIPRCNSHALYELNRLIIAQDSYLDGCIKNCSCNAGRHSVGNVHTSDCATFIQLSLDKAEEDDSSNSAA